MDATTDISAIYRSPKLEMLDGDFKQVGDYWFEVCRGDGTSETRESETQYSMRFVEHKANEPFGLRFGRFTPIDAKSVDEAVEMVNAMFEDHKQLVKVSDNQDNIMLPNGGCKYISHYYDKDMEKWVVLYEQKPGINTKAQVDTGVPKPVLDKGMIKYVHLNPFAANVARKSPGKRLDGPKHEAKSRGFSYEGIEEYMRESDRIHEELMKAVGNMTGILDEGLQKQIEKAERDAQKSMDQLDAELDKALGWLNDLPLIGDGDDEGGPL